ncbi:Tfx family DNA-binding protein [Haloarcula sp. CBA1127]|uniref:Tfx family DNA-binding protein n=1 Tax=Haloarcula sp. CBA1127 TaxID=1765055 RepID=UPI0009ACE8C9|nr:Tfx family DNA-binding protein [Haloarcula sp. CBA1127]
MAARGLQQRCFQSSYRPVAMDERIDPDELLAAVGFDADESVLTRRQAEVLALREHDIRQSDIGELLGTSRANISSIERNARENVKKARQTIVFANTLTAPVRVDIAVGTDIYDVPQTVYAACDEAGVEVNYGSSNLLQLIDDAVDGAVQQDTVQVPLRIDVTNDGVVHVRERSAERTE